MKEGIFTSEFWISIGTIAAATALCALGKIDATMWSVAVGSIGGAYSVSRGLAKSRQE
jgi:hypothetical protein